MQIRLLSGIEKTLKMNIDQINEYQTTNDPLFIEDIKTLYGANYFSAGPVTRVRLNLGKYDEVFSNNIPNLLNRLKKDIPSLIEHHCSVGKKGGLFERIKEGTLLGHIMEHIIIEFQVLAGMEVGFGKTRMTKTQGVYNVVYRFIDEIAGIYTGKAALNYLNAVLNNTVFNVQEIIETLVLIREKRLLGPSTQAIVREAEQRKIPWFRLDKYNQVQLGTGKYRKIIRATITEDTSLIAVETADNKFLTNSLLSDAGIPVPEQLLTDQEEVALSFHEKVKKPIVIKPLTGFQGEGVNIGMETPEQITNAFQWAQNFDDQIIVQEDIPGNTYRILIIDFKFVAATQLLPPFIIGNDKNTIQELINELNKDIRREFGDKGILSIIDIDDDTKKILELSGYDASSIAKAGEKIFLKNTGNMRLGASSIDVTEVIDGSYIFIAERISKLLNLNICGIDIISPDISKPIHEANAKIIEVNAAPDFRMHISPTLGESHKVERNFVNMLFPENSKFQIPVFAITGSYGKNLAANIIMTCLQENNLICGHVSKNGLFVGNHCLKNSDATDSKNHGIVLSDPGIDCAIIETPVETILKSGIGYGFANFGLVLNLDKQKYEYLDYDHIRDMDDIAYAKSVVAEEVHDYGYTILNADDEFIYEMNERLYSKLALFSKRNNNEYLQKCLKKQGVIAYVNETNIIIQRGKMQIMLIALSEIPEAIKRKNEYYIDSLLAASLSLFLFGISAEKIKGTILRLK